jgi:hypothetical protein
VQSISDIKAITYNVSNGKLMETKLTDDNITIEALTKNTSVKKITIPNVREGSIIELKYKISSNGVSYIPDWNFQEKEPVIWSEYEASIPEYLDFLPLTQGNTPYLVNTKEEGTDNIPTAYTPAANSGKVIATNVLELRTKVTGSSRWKVYKYKWVQKDVPSLKLEAYMTSIRDYQTRISFQLKGFYNIVVTSTQETRGNTMVLNSEFSRGLYNPINNSWDKLGEELMDTESLGGVIDKKNATKDVVATVVGDLNTPKEKAAALYTYIGKNYTTNEGKSVLMSQSLNDLLKSHKGTPSDLNLLFINMLRVAGVKASPMLISTRGHGRINRFYPFLDRLDKTLVHIELNEKESIIADISGYPQPMNILPFEDLNGEGFIIKEATSTGWATVKSSVTTRQFKVVNVALNTEGVVIGDLNYAYSGYEAVENRDKIKEIGEEKHIKFVTKSLISDGTLENYKIENPDRSSDLPLKIKAKIKSSSCANKAEDKIYLNPLACVHDMANPFKMEDRLYDIDFGEPRDAIFQITVAMPEGYKIEDMPKTARYLLGDNALKFEYLISTKDNSINIMTKLSIKQTIFPPEDYKELKQTYAKIVAKMGEQIVLSKI